MSSQVDRDAPSLGRVDGHLDDHPNLGMANGRPARVLIVNVDAEERSHLRSTLEPLGHRIVEATSGADARRRCVANEEFAVILLDVRGANADAFETAELIRSREASDPTPIIFLTAAGRSEEEMSRGYEMGVVDFIAAPIIPAALRGKVSLFADVFAKTQELVERSRQLRAAASSSAEALAFQLEMLDRMEQLGRAKSDFVSKISHELRSPLTSVIGYVELLVDGGPGEPNAEQSRMLAIIERNSRRLLALIEDLLTMSRVEAGTFELEVGRVDVHELLQRVTESTAPAIAKAELRLTLDVGSVVELAGDTDQLERVVLNLVSNAVKFTPPGGDIEISTGTEADDFLLPVRDTGSGIELAEQEHLFTRFFRSTQAKEQQVAGTGLGLYIVKQIIELHGGSIGLTSTPAGSTFTVRIPISGPPADPSRWSGGVDDELSRGFRNASARVRSIFGRCPLALVARDPTVFAQDLFDGLPRRYDALAEVLSFGQNRRWRREMVGRVARACPASVLDVATGTAGVALELVRRTPGRVTGIDLTRAMLERGRTRVEQAGASARVQLVVGQGERLPFPDATFDALTFTYLLRYVADPGATLEELARVVKPGGTIASLEFAVPDSPFWRAWWWAYTRFVLPVGGYLTGGKEWFEVGRFLGPNISAHYQRYSVPWTIEAWERAGLTEVGVRKMSLGGGIVMWANKPDR